MKWFWYFLIYSFLGFILEVLFARVTASPKRDRKCFLVLPLCPVYGLGALLILLLPAGARQNPWLLFPLGALCATAAEYATGTFYQRALGVRFWDYSQLPLNIGGQVCLLFSFFWGLLALGLVRFVHPWVAAWTAHLPSWLGALWMAVVVVDGAASAAVLAGQKTTDALLWYRSRP